MREEAWEEEVFLTWRAIVGGVREGCGGGGVCGVAMSLCRCVAVSLRFIPPPSSAAREILAHRNSPTKSFFFAGEKQLQLRKRRETITPAAMITATTWVPKGFAAQFPKRYDVSEEEFARIADMAKLQLADAQEDLNEARAEAASGGGEGGAGGEAESEDEEVGGDADGEKGKKARRRAKKKAKKAAAVAAVAAQLKQTENEDEKEDMEE